LLLFETETKHCSSTSTIQTSNANYNFTTCEGSPKPELLLIQPLEAIMTPQASFSYSFHSFEVSDDSSTSDSTSLSSLDNQYQTNITKSVRFSTDVDVHPVLHHQDMSQDEVYNTWISRFERKQSRSVVESTIYLMKTGVGCKFSDEDFFCPRGLERRFADSSEYDEEVKKSKKIALAMQRLLRRSGKTSPEMIAKAYRKFTIRSCSLAIRKAKMDQDAAAVALP
jgi:hypothetical protein